MPASLEEGRARRSPALDFFHFWWGQAASNVGDAFALVAMPLLVLDVTGSVAQMGNVTAVACGAHLAMSLVAGIVVDRVDRRRLMIATDLGRMVLYAALPVASWLRASSLALVYVVAALASALGNLFLVAQVAAVASIVDRDRLARANSRLQATQALMFAIGPVLAGVVCARYGTTAALAVDAATFAVSAFSLSLVRFRAVSAIAGDGARPRAGRGGSDLLTGLRFLFDQPVLRAIMVLQVFVSLLASAGMSGAMVDLFVFRLRHDLGASGRVVGLCMGGAAIGALCGALASPRLRARSSSGACILGGTGLQAIGLGVSGFVSSAGATMAGLGLWSAGLTLRAVVNVSLRQELTPDALLGRVMASATTVVFGAGAIGAVLVTHAAARWGSSDTLSFMGAGLGAIVTLGAAVAVRMTSLRPAPAGACGPTESREA
jgi:MFS family permease